MKDLRSFVNKVNVERCCDEALDLLRKLLDPDKQTRITASEALSHPYFQGI